MSTEPQEVTELREWLRAELAAAERAKARAQFEDMGEDECETCRRARLRSAFRGASQRRRVKR